MPSTHKLEFNGHDLGELCICEFGRPVLAPVGATFEQVPGAHGETFKTAVLQGYDLEVTLWLREEHRGCVADARHELAAMLWTDEPKPLYLPDDPEKYVLAIVSGSTDLGIITNECPSCTVVFHVGSPVSYGQSRTAQIGESTVSVVAGGTWRALPKITCQLAEAVKSWRITNRTTGEYVEIVGSFSLGSTVRIDMATERATVNNLGVDVSIASDFFAIEGTQRLIVSSGTATMEWNETWL